jgi:HD-like signal output (HDOD) protein
MGYPLLDAEVLSYPEDHTALGAKIAREWDLPESFVDAITYHHKPEMSGEMLSAIVYLADKHDGEQIEDCYPVERTAAVLEMVGEPSQAVHTADLSVLEGLAA